MFPECVHCFSMLSLLETCLQLGTDVMRVKNINSLLNPDSSVILYYILAIRAGSLFCCDCVIIVLVLYIMLTQFAL
jgi:hypothetical protein